MGNKAVYADFVGKTYSRLTVLDYVRSDGTHTYWLCKCSCGNTKILSKNTVKRGGTKSCGCLKKESVSNLKHGLSRTSVYKVWHAIVQRCYNPNCKVYKNYGQRGIFLSDDWRKFETFYDQFGKNKPYKGTIDRIDNDGPYSLENCQWISIADQQKNKRTVKLRPYKGTLVCAKTFFRENKIPKSSGYFYLDKGMSICEIKDKYDLKRSMDVANG